MRCAFSPHPHLAEDLSETGTQDRDAVLHTPAHQLRDMPKGKQKKSVKDTARARNIGTLTFWVVVTEDGSHSRNLVCFPFFFPRFPFSFIVIDSGLSLLSKH